MMALPKRRDTGGDAPRSTPGGHFPAGPQISRHPTGDVDAGHRRSVWLERRNGMPALVPYVYQAPAAGGGNCHTCELWTGCGGLFCSHPIQRRSTGGA